MDGGQHLLPALGDTANTCTAPLPHDVGRAAHVQRGSPTRRRVSARGSLRTCPPTLTPHRPAHPFPKSNDKHAHINASRSVHALGPCLRS